MGSAEIVAVAFVLLIVAAVAVPIGLLGLVIYLIVRAIRTTPPGAMEAPPRRGAPADAGGAKAEWTVSAGKLDCRVFHEHYVGLASFANVTACLERCLRRVEKWLDERPEWTAVTGIDVSLSRGTAHATVWYRERRAPSPRPARRAAVFSHATWGLTSVANRRATVEGACAKAAEWIDEQGGSIRVVTTSGCSFNLIAFTIVWWEPAIARSSDAGRAAAPAARR